MSGHLGFCAGLGVNLRSTVGPGWRKLGNMDPLILFFILVVSGMVLIMLILVVGLRLVVGRLDRIMRYLEAQNKGGE